MNGSLVVLQVRYSTDFRVSLGEGTTVVRIYFNPITPPDSTQEPPLIFMLKRDLLADLAGLTQRIANNVVKPELETEQLTLDGRKSSEKEITVRLSQEQP